MPSAHGQALDREAFRNPFADSRQTIAAFWFWNDTVTDAETERQLRLMHRAGVRQATVHARSGLQNAYLSEDWFDRVKHAVQVAKELGMLIWLYDEDGWPSGNASWTLTRDEEAREHYLEIHPVVLQPGETYLPGAGELLALTVCEDGECRPLPLPKDGGFTASRPCVLYPAALHVDPYDGLGKYSIDYMSARQIRRFIECTHEEYARRFGDEFGRTIRGLFMDETRFCHALPWTADFREDFIARKGYDIVPLLYLLVRDGENSDFVRYDYYDFCADRMREAAFGQIQQWAGERGILTTGHFLGEETLASQSRFNMDIMRHYGAFDMPGIDHLGNGVGSLDAKICSSAAHNYGRDLVGSESFGACGWDMDLESVVRISNWLYQQGVNHHMMHGFYYSIRGERKNDWPPSYFFHWRDWERLPSYTAMAARMSAALSGGAAETGILVYYPIETFWTHFRPNFTHNVGYFKDGPQIETEKARRMDRGFQRLGASLLDRNLDFEYWNSDAAGNFEAVDGKLVNRLTGASYAVLVLPYVELLPENILPLIAAFAAGGGKVIAYRCDFRAVAAKDGAHRSGRPAAPPGASAYLSPERIEDVVELCAQFSPRPYAVLSGTDGLCRSQSHYPGRVHDPYLHDGETQTGVGITRYRKGDRRILNLTNYNGVEEPLVLWVESESAPEIWNPEDGGIVVPDCAEQAENGRKGYRLSLKLPPNRALFVVCTV